MPAWSSGQSIAACLAWWGSCEKEGQSGGKTGEAKAALCYEFQIKELKAKGYWVPGSDGDLNKPVRSGSAIRQRANEVTSSCTTHIFNYFVQATKPLVTGDASEVDASDDRGYDLDDDDEGDDDEPKILRNVKWPRGPKSSGSQRNDVIRVVPTRWWEKIQKQKAEERYKRDPTFDTDAWLASQTMATDWTDPILDVYLQHGYRISRFFRDIP